MLLQLFSLFCFHCNGGSPHLSVTKNGTMVTVIQDCAKCGRKFKWNSQPLILGRFPAGNILLSFSTLMAGVSLSKVLLMMRHFGMSMISARTYFYHQQIFLFPAIIQCWNDYQKKLFEMLSPMKDTVWAGDGRFDSMGHSAKYGAYTMLCPTVMKIGHFELVQVINRTFCSIYSIFLL